MPDQILAHLRRYPRWYTAAVAWLVLMVVLPVVGVDALGAIANVAPGGGGSPTATAPIASGVTVPVRTGGGTVSAPDPAAVIDAIIDNASPDTATPDEEAPPLEEIPPGEEVSAGPLDALFDALPTPPGFAMPEELQPIADVVAPIVTYGCSATGLATLVIAVVAPSVEQVPLEKIIPYLAPVTVACAAFPIPQTHTECESDKPFIIDVGGLTKSPPILGLGIDEIQAMEDLIMGQTGQQIPRLSDQLRERLNCRIVST